MKKILFGLIVCALLVGMTSVVSATDGDRCCNYYCKVTGGGTVDNCGSDFVTVAFNAKGSYCTNDNLNGDVEGMVNIVYHKDKTKVKFDVVGIEECRRCDGSAYIKLKLNGENCNSYYLEITDNGEGSNAPCDEINFYGNCICNDGYDAFSGCLSGNAQVRTKEVPV